MELAIPVAAASTAEPTAQWFSIGSILTETLLTCFTCVDSQRKTTSYNQISETEEEGPVDVDNEDEYGSDSAYADVDHVGDSSNHSDAKVSCGSKLERSTYAVAD